MENDTKETSSKFKNTVSYFLGGRKSAYLFIFLAIAMIGWLYSVGTYSSALLENPVFWRPITFLGFTVGAVLTWRLRLTRERSEKSLFPALLLLAIILPTLPVLLFIFALKPDSLFLFPTLFSFLGGSCFMASASFIHEHICWNEKTRSLFLPTFLGTGLGLFGSQYALHYVDEHFLGAACVVLVALVLAVSVYLDSKGTAQTTLKVSVVGVTILLALAVLFTGFSKSIQRRLETTYFEITFSR